MSDNKKYYYLRLKEDFFESDNMILLETLQDGYLYSNILLKLYLRSLKHEGRLALNNRIPYNTQMLATITRHQVGTIEKAMEIFKELGLVEILDSGVIYVADIQSFIGKSSTEADRKRQFRERIQKERETGQIADKCPDKCQTPSDKCPDDRPPEREIEIRDKRLDIEIDINKKEYCAFFEELWKAYPVKKGKGRVSDTMKKKLYAVGMDELKRAIERYQRDLKKDAWRQPQHGSTFFNSGYVDYLDCNYSGVDKQPVEVVEVTEPDPEPEELPEGAVILPDGSVDYSGLLEEDE